MTPFLNALSDSQFIANSRYRASATKSNKLVKLVLFSDHKNTIKSGVIYNLVTIHSRNTSSFETGRSQKIHSYNHNEMNEIDYISLNGAISLSSNMN